jgi:chemotaxis receptor (MCP) glutamine deamidase CheD
MLLVTVLGSCVAACIRDPKTGIGGMNHFMLPEGGGDQHDMLSSSARYGGYAMEVLVNQLVKLGASRNRLEAKVFGGAAVLRGFTTVNVGEMNSEFVLDYLRTERIRVVAEDLRDVGIRARSTSIPPPAGSWCASSRPCTTTPSSIANGLQPASQEREHRRRCGVVLLRL